MEAFFDVFSKLPTLSQDLERHITGLNDELSNLEQLRRSLMKGIEESFEAEVLKLQAIKAKQQKEVDNFIDAQVSILNQSIDSLKISQNEATEMSRASDINSMRRVAVAIESGTHDKKHLISYYAGQVQPQSLLDQAMDLVKLQYYKNTANLEISFLTGSVTVTPGDRDQQIPSGSQAAIEEHKSQEQADQSKLLVTRATDGNLHVFNIDSGEYRLINPNYELPCEDGAERYESYQEHIYVLGGERIGAICEVKTVDMTGKSEDLPNMTVARGHLATIIVGKYLYAIGGEDKHKKALASCERLEIQNPAQWKAISPLETPAGGGRCISTKDRILHLGGAKTQEDFLDLVQEYSLPNDKWSSAGTRLPVRCVGLGAAMGNKGILMWGGRIDEGVSDAIYLLNDRVGSLPRKGGCLTNQIIRNGYCYVWLWSEDCQSNEKRVIVLKMRLSDGTYQQLEARKY